MKSLISVAILLVSCIVFVSAVTKRATVCQTDACKKSAQYLLSAIDQTQDPCNDFYQFACGGFIAKTKLPADAIEYGVHDILTDKATELIQVILETVNSSNTKTVQNAQSLYSKCINQGNDVALLKDEVVKLGGWPLVTGQPNTLSIEVLLASVIKTGTGSIILAGVGEDLIDSNQFIIEVDDTDQSLPESFLGNQTNLNTYINSIKASAVALGAPNSQATTDQVNSLIQFGRKIVNITPDVEVIVNFTEIYQKSTIGELQQLTDPSSQTFNWLTFFNALFGLKLTTSEPVAIYDLEYLIQAIELIKSTDKNTVANYIIGAFVQNYAIHAGGALLQEAITLIEAFTGVTAIEPRNSSCAEFANEVFGYALAKPYVAKVFPASNIQQVTQIAQELQAAFQVGVSQTPFYDAKTLKVIQDKLGAVQLLLGYPSFINDDQAVEKYYADFPEMNGHHFTNALNSLTSLFQQDLNLLHTKVDKSSFNLIPSIVVEEYDASNNAITVPAGIIQAPYYTAGQLKALDFGALGSLVGTALNEAINNNGRQFDQNGNLNNLWPVAVLDAIDNTLDCISNQFKTYCSKTNPTECVNGTADKLDAIFGILGAYNAYQTWVSKNAPEPQLPGLEKYSSNQLLFLNYAQRFCTATVPANIVAKIGTDPQLENRFTVIGALSNLKEFSQDFKCPVGPMNRGSESCVPI